MFLLVTFVSYVTTLVSIQGFGVKCSYVYGFFLSAATFRMTVLCETSLTLFSDVVLMINDQEKVSLMNHMNAMVRMQPYHSRACPYLESLLDERK